MKTLVIAEKPSVGRDIAKVLKCTQKGDGFLHGNHYIISWAIGHLATLKEPEDYDPSLKRWAFSSLPIMPENMGLRALPKTITQLNLLKKLMNDKEVTAIICATDSGREGELIFRYIYHWAKCKKPVKRLWISSLTDAAISDGLAKMKDGQAYDNLYASAKCRAEADWLVGMNATRAFTLACGDLLPMGRVQTPTLAMLVNRYHEIKNFDPRDYWEITADFEATNAQIYQGIWLDAENENTDRTYDKEKAENIAEKIKNKPAIVESIDTEEKRQQPPQLFDLTELQRECNRKLSFPAKKTLEVAQALYEKHKLITYPRTDSRYLSKDMVSKLTPILQSITDDPYKCFADDLLALPKLPITTRIVNDTKVTDHHAIIPTGGKKPLSALTSDERAVYDRILRNFLAAFHPPHIYDVTTVITRVESEPFRTRGRMEKSPGWTVIYAHEKPTKKATDQEDVSIPTLSKGEAVNTIEVEVHQKKTQPPKPYTEATLLSAMENAGRFVEDDALKEALKSSGLGTPATRAAMIEKLISSGYVERVKKNLTPTEKGIKLISIVPPEMRQPETTGKWERGLSRIAEGELDESRFMASIRRYVMYLVDEARKM
ncbi:MAG: DNA topoisomerase III [Defluviitaleaceae bacterium]|nr:DNA topoisomerase III [Defluviitaleaceae bacterium]